MRINIKAAAAGLLMLLVITILGSIALGLIAPQMYSSMLTSGRLTSSQFALWIMLSIVQFGIPGYIVASITQSGRTLTALAVAVLGATSLIALSWADMRQSLLSVAITLIVAILTAIGGAQLRRVF